MARATNSFPVPVSPVISTVLDVAAIQLGFVAQREANLARMASHAEHLGRLALVASRISAGVAITDRHGTIEHYAAVKERLVAGVQAGETVLVAQAPAPAQNTAPAKR